VAAIVGTRELLKEQIEQIRPLLQSTGADGVLRDIYPQLMASRDEGSHSAAKPIEAIGRFIQAVAAFPPHRAQAWQAMSTELGLTDLERVLVYVGVLRNMPYETVWIHFGLADALNRLVTGGTMAARVPCIIHCLLAINRRDGDRLYEPMPRSILVRELASLFPRDAMANGLEALSLGYLPPYRQTVDIAAGLGVAGPVVPSSPDLGLLRTIAAKCDLDTFKNSSAVVLRDVPAAPPRVVMPAEVRLLPKPKGDGTHYLFREAQKPISLPAIAVHDIKNGMISFDVSNRGRTTFYVFDENRVCMTHLSQGLTPFILDEPCEIGGTIAVLGDQYSGPLNICHFLLDHLSRIRIYQAHSPNEPIAYALFAGHQYCLDVAAMAGYGDQLIAHTSVRMTLRADRLLFSSNIVKDFRHPAHLCASWAMDFLREKLKVDAPQNRKRRIFISRAEDAKSRQIINRSEVERLVCSFGYEVVALGSMSARQQRDLFADASHVVGVHGAGLSNVLFSAVGTKVLEILPCLVATPAYWILCSQLGLDYHTLIAADPDYPRPDYEKWGHHEEFNARHLVVPLDDLRSSLISMEGASLA